jgi:hypothetical protein
MSDERELPRVGQKWRHYRTGTVYRVALLGMLEPTGEPAVCYQAVIGDGRVWIRSLHDFMGEATGMPGVPRFTKED